MHSMERFDVSTLNWVKGEIDETLKQARIALETFAESGEDANQLQFCISYLHQVAGTLQMVELRGAAKFATEIESTAVALQEGRVAERDAAFEVLMRAILQLPDYLESLQSGSADNPIVLLGLLNELRHIRGEKALNESIFFNPDLSVMPRQYAQEPAVNFQALVRKLRPYYQVSLLKILRDEESTPHLKTLRTVVEKLLSVSQLPNPRQWLWILGGYIEALHDGGLTLDNELKQILGRNDQLLRLLIEKGEAGLKDEHMAVLNRSMLFKIAKSSSRGARCRELRDAFQLDQLVPESVQTGQVLLGGFNAELKRTVSSDVLNELGRVKDVFDIFVRSEQRNTSDLAPLADGLSTIAETLVLLRQEDLSLLLKQQSAVLRQLVNGEVTSDDSLLMGVAGAILSVESALTDWGSVGPVEKADDSAGQLSASEVGVQAEAEHQRVVRQVMKEARDEIIRVRESLSQYLESQGDKSLLNSVPTQLHELIGSLTMLSYRRVAQVLRACRVFVINDLLNGQAIPSTEKLDALADAIMSTEYYLEAFVQSRVHPGSVLEVAERGVAELGYPVDPDSLTSAELAIGGEAGLASSTEKTERNHLEPEAMPVPDFADSESLAMPADEVLSNDVINIDEATLPPLNVQRSVVTQPAVTAPTNPEVDEEILEIFLEEAQEELSNISTLLPRWTENPADDEALRDLRRSFHTLKGSGRLVGASTLGEFAWAFESMLNRVIDDTVKPSPAMFDMLDQARDAIAQLIANFRDGSSLSDDVEMLREAAHEMVQPGGMQLKTPPITPAVATPAPAPIVQPSESRKNVAQVAERLELDPVLLEIYEKETEGHLSQISEFVDNFSKGQHRVNEPLIRALHTLTGSSRMAGVQLVSELTSVLEKYAKTLQVERLSIPQEGVSLLGDCVSFVNQVMAHLLDANSNALPDNSSLLARAASLYATVQHAEESVAARPEEGLASKPETVVEGTETVEALSEAEQTSAQQASEMSFADELIDISVPPLEPRVVTSELAAEEPIELTPLDTMESSPELAHPEADESPFGQALGGIWEAEPITMEVTPRESTSADDLQKAFEILEPATVVVPQEPEIQLVEQRPEPVQQKAPVAQQAPAPLLQDYDPELLEIFLEEGSDILNESEETLQAWVSKPDDRALVEALQRQLHTLKGGARMAGIKAIGDLGHSLESTFEAVVEGRLARSKRMMDLLQLAHDRLVEMLEQVRNQEPLSSGDDLIQQIYALGKAHEGAPEHPVEPATQKAEVRGPIATVPEVVPVPEVELPAVEIIGDPFEHLIANGGERIAHLTSKAITWRNEPENVTVIDELRREAELLMREAGAAVIVEITELAKGIVDLLKAVEDGHVSMSEKVFGLLASCTERLDLIFGQLLKKTQLSNGIYLIGNIDELIKSSIAEQRAASGLQEDDVTVVSTAAALMKASKLDEEQEADENRRRGARVQHEMVRVRADLLDNMVNFAGEVSIYRSRVEQQLGSIRFNIDDLDQTVTRLREQVRKFDIETEAQIESRYGEVVGQEYEDFDPLEFDRFTNMQQLSRSMMESLNDLLSIEETMLNLSRESETLLLQQSRVNTELQETLMHTRMIPLVEHAPRLRRIVRQTCAELNKEANLSFKGAEVEMDRNVVDRILAPLEHMLRNSVAHGIETGEKRLASGKTAEGSITVALAREGSEIVIRVSDDGAGINLDAVRKKAVDKGLMAPDAKLSDKEVMHFILESGFSTAETLSQIAGRGVGMDVVASEIKQLGGILEIDSLYGKGTLFTVRLPLTLSVSRALLVYAGEDIYAIPLLSITGIERISKEALAQQLSVELPKYRWVGQDYDLMHLSQVLGVTSAPPPQEGDKVSLLLAQSGNNRIALAVDGLVGNREIVVKSLGAQLSTLQDISGATILADGHVALIIDLPALIRRGLAKRTGAAVEPVVTAAPSAAEPVVMVVDDSITVRKVTERLLKRHNMKCVTAKDGVDALAVLEDVTPDVMLLDIEMPRMDGYELATHIRNSARFQKLPIIMITSRTGEKHRQRAMDIGVNIYMGKPYTETDLLENIESLLNNNG